MMIYELRIYMTAAGRMPDLLKRFENHTLRIWERHGVRQAGFWTTLVGPSRASLTYMLVWDTLADREHRWKEFQSDQEWLDVVAETESNGPLILDYSNSFLEPTKFSSAR